jgi:hypothetical protein
MNAPFGQVDALRANIIRFNQQAIRIKLVFFYDEMEVREK